METTTQQTYTIKELQEHDYRAYERAIEKLCEIEFNFFIYEDPIACEGNSFFERIESPIRISNALSIDRLDEYSCEIGWRHTNWDFCDNVLSYLNHDLARDIARITKVIGCDLHEFFTIGGNHGEPVEVYYRYRATRTKRVDRAISDVVDQINNWLTDVEHEVMKHYRDEIEYRSSEEYLIELADINQYRYDTEGNSV